MAYHRSQSSAVQVAKIIAVTVVLMSVVLGSFLLASAYVTANASCRQLEQELELLSEAADRFQAPSQPEALIQEERPQRQNHIDSLQQEENRKKNNDVNNDIESSESENSDSVDSNADNNSDSESEEEERTPIHFNLPLQLDFDDLAGALIAKNKKSRMNCVVEKKRAEEIVDHQAKTLKLPFGLNLTTDPRYERISGERMAIFCESGNVQKQTPPEDDNEEETIMIQPVMIPIPQTHFPTHMAQQMRPVPQQQQFHPMETMRPPMPPPMQEQQSQLPPNPVLHHIAQQIIMQKIMEARQAREEQQNQESQSNSENGPRFSVSEELMTQRIPVPEEVLTQLNRLPNRDVIVTISRQEPEEMSQESQEVRVDPQEMRLFPQEIRVIPQENRPAPQDVNAITQEINNAPQDARSTPPEMRPVAQVMRQEMHVVQQPRENAQEVNGRQTYGRGLPVHIPIHMIQQQEETPQAAASEESRPHYVQPRSVRSVDALLSKSQKRVKRCSCDCAC